MYPFQSPHLLPFSLSDHTVHLRAGLSFHSPGKVESLAEADQDFNVDIFENVMLIEYPSAHNQTNS